MAISHGATGLAEPFHSPSSLYLLLPKSCSIKDRLGTEQQYDEESYADSIDNQGTNEYSADPDLAHLQASVAQSEMQPVTMPQQGNSYAAFPIPTNQTLETYGPVLDADPFGLSAQLYTKGSNHISKAMTSSFYGNVELEVLRKRFEVETAPDF